MPLFLSPGITFFDAVKFALEHYAQPQVLGEQSPLAAPYFLGAVLNATHAATPVGRGQALVSALDSALEALWGSKLPTQRIAMLQTVEEEEGLGNRTVRYDVLVLELNYFRHCFNNPPPRNQAEIYSDILHIARPTHDRHLKNAIERLAATLLAQVRPTFQPEMPVLPGYLIGRSAVYDQCLAALHKGQSVSVIGASGIGKTAVGSAVAHAWSTKTVFWFTLRLTINDQLNSLLFALGHFLQQLGSANLWSQLVANGGRLNDANLALGLVRADLAHLPNLPLLCFDEIDRLQRIERDITTEQTSPQSSVNHQQMQEFIYGLQGYAPLLLISQRPLFTTAETYRLTRLSTIDIEAWLQANSIAFTAQEVEQLGNYTGGNPRLLELCVALYQTGQTATALLPAPTLADVLRELQDAPTLASIWQRLQQRLSSEERHLLQTLSVFRTPAPRDAWTEVATGSLSTPISMPSNEKRTDIIMQLVNLHLIQEDEFGAIFLLPALRALIYAELTVAQRLQFHLQAAHIRALRGEYTAAAYHYVESEQPERAIQLWHAKQEQEIARGQANAALAIFQNIPLQRLLQKEQETVALICGELQQLVGNLLQAQQNLASVQWSPDHAISVDAARLWGDLLSMQGDPAGALDKYDEGLALIAHLLARNTHLHIQKGLVHLRQGAMSQAWRSANLARYATENLLGAIQDMSGNFSVARSHFRVALAIAEDINFGEGIAQTQQDLAINAARQQDVAAAIAHHQKATEYYQRIGDQVKIARGYSALAGIHMQTGQYKEAIETAHVALTFFQRLQDSYRIAANAVNLAESYFEQGDYKQSQFYAELVLQQEELRPSSYALFTLGRLCQVQGKLEAAEAQFTQAKALAQQNEDNSLLAYILRELGTIYLVQQKKLESNTVLHEAIQLFIQQGIMSEVAKTKQLAAQVMI